MYSVHCEIISTLKCLVVAPVETDRSDRPSQENAYVLAEDRTHLILSYIQFFFNGKLAITISAIVLLLHHYV